MLKSIAFYCVNSIVFIVSKPSFRVEWRLACFRDTATTTVIEIKFERQQSSHWRASAIPATHPRVSTNPLDERKYNATDNSR